MPSFLAIAAAAGLVGIGIAQVPLPSAAGALDGSYVHAVGFFIEPLLVVPMTGLALTGGVRELEHHSARSLIQHRILLILLLTAVPILCLLPSAATHPAPQPIQVMVENVLFVTGEACVLATLLPGIWLWAPITAMSLIGIMGPDRGLLTNLVGVNRTASAGDLVAAVIVLMVGGAIYLLLWPEPRLVQLIDRRSANLRS